MDAESASSVLVSRTLNDLGYNQRMVRIRKPYWGKFEFQSEHFYCFIAGSKSEGLTKMLENDVDVLLACKNILCTSRNTMPYNNVGDLAVLHMDRTNTAPGYTKLIYVKIGTFTSFLLDSALTEPIGGNIYLSSDAWRERARQYNAELIAEDPIIELRQQPAQGPSDPISAHLLGFHTDNVFAIICDCPEILQSWIQRPRRHGWPPARVIEEISTLEAHVVPVGFKGSPCQFLEWRICFTRAEIKLIQSLNDSQIKLTVLLKMIAKSSLKPVCKDMTTYVMKNVVLWLAELYPPDYFTEQNLLLSLKIALKFLRQCLSVRFLPSYMIPERNLLVNTLTHANGPGLSESTILSSTIDSLLLEGPHVVYRCEKIRKAWKLLNKAPATFCSFTNACRQAEIMFLLSVLLCGSDEPDAKDKSDCLQLAFTLTMLPHFKDLLHLNEGNQELLLNRMKSFLS